MKCEIDSPYCEEHRSWWRRLFRPTKLVKCYPMTCYGNEPKSYVSCNPCAEEYTSMWQERWDEYYAEIRAGLYYESSNRDYFYDRCSYYNSSSDD